MSEGRFRIRQRTLRFFAALDRNLEGILKEFGTTTECQTKV